MKKTPIDYTAKQRPMEPPHDPFYKKPGKPSFDVYIHMNGQMLRVG